MSIETEYLGRKIVYAENEDVWRCWDLDVDGATLSAVKAKIAKLDADARRVPDMPAVRLDYQGGTTPCTISMLDPDRDNVWVLMQEPGDKVAKRHKVPMDRIVLLTPENELALVAYHAADAAAKEARKVAEDAKGKIRFATRDDFEGVVENAERRDPFGKRRRRR